MRVFLAGATGFIGGHVLRTLMERGHEVTCLVRGSGRPPMRPGVRVVEGECTEPGTWLSRVAGHEAVVNAVGIIREGRGTGSFEAVHTRAAGALFTEAARAGASKAVQISAMGADEKARSRYHLTKRAADEHLSGLGVPYVVLRPSVVYGPGDHSMALFSRLAALPVTPVPGDGRYLLQPVHVGDVAKAVTLIVERDDLRTATVDLGGPEAVTFDALLDLLARRIGKVRGARKAHVPWPLVRLVAAATDALGRGPITSEELVMLRRGNHADVEPFVSLFGFETVPLEKGLALR